MPIPTYLSDRPRLHSHVLFYEAERCGADTEMWTVESPTEPTRQELDALGVAPDVVAEGCLDDNGVMRWDFVAERDFPLDRRGREA